ncbi:ruvB-like 2 [Pyrus ussuriensis x Pyrus communis]|uniref:RuvB-like 2 n=1 Tax=Pyrus ussuriensis x Pyrus communis TaxID=2448454 RepID=A0A5N5H2V7_9ROSA|nr:ruvB-like 2 [Pyrus ussuriensis x Pyrus communis]
MSGSEGSSDEGSFCSGSRFEPPRSSLESYEEEMLGDLHDHQTCIPSDEVAALKIAASKRAKTEAIGCDAAIVAGEERRLLPPFPNIDPIFPPVMEHTGQKENKQLMDDTRKTSKALIEAVQLKDQTMEWLKRWNGENLRLKKHSGDESEDNTTADKQTQQGEDGPEYAEDCGDSDGGETHQESSTSDEDDS